MSSKAVRLFCSMREELAFSYNRVWFCWPTINRAGSVKGVQVGMEWMLSEHEGGSWLDARQSVAFETRSNAVLRSNCAANYSRLTGSFLQIKCQRNKIHSDKLFYLKVSIKTRAKQLFKRIKDKWIRKRTKKLKDALIKTYNLNRKRWRIKDTTVLQRFPLKK